jgi:hypothetical protein
MEKAYSGGSILLAFVLGIITVLSIVAVHLIAMPLSYSIFLDLIFFIFYILILLAIYKTGRVNSRTERAINLDDLTSQINKLNIPGKHKERTEHRDIESDFADKNLLSELKSIENEIKKGTAFHQNEPNHDEEYQYVASTKGNIYHTPKCRLAKAINKKFKAYNNNPEFFEKRKYKPCKLCVK